MMTNEPIMLTVDLEADWGGKEVTAIPQILPKILALFEQYSVTATFFVVAELVEDILPFLPPDNHHEVASHGLTHRMLTGIPDKDVWEEVKKSKDILTNAGYNISGFRAPYLKSPSILPQILAQTGYKYDASAGSVSPTLFHPHTIPTVWHTSPAVSRLTTSTLRDRITPFSLTWLRIMQPISTVLIPSNPKMFYFHLHELLSNTTGWKQLPLPLRALHKRNSGEAAWAILDKLLNRFNRRFISCREYLKYNEMNIS